MTGVPPPQIQQQPQAQQQPGQPGGLVGKIPEGARPLAAVGALGAGFAATAGLKSLLGKIDEKFEISTSAAGNIDPLFYGGGAAALLQGLMRRRWTEVIYTGAISQTNNLYKLATEIGYDFDTFGKNAVLQLGVLGILYGLGRAIRGRR